MSKGRKRRIPWSVRFALFCCAARPAAMVAFFSFQHLKNALEKDAEQLLIRTVDSLKDLARQRFDMVANHAYTQEMCLRKQLESLSAFMSGLCIRTELCAARRHITRSSAKELTIQILSSLNSSGNANRFYGYIVSGTGHIITHPRLPTGFDLSGQAFIREMIRRSEGSICYYWKNPGETEARERLAVFWTFPPWDWLICFAGLSGEEEDLFKTQSIVGLKEYVVSMHLPWAGSAMILSSDGRVIAHPILASEKAENIPGGKAILKQKNGICRYTDDMGRVWIAGVTSFQPWEWVLAVTVQNDVLEEPLHKLKWYLLAGTTFLGIANYIFLLFIYRKLALAIYARRRPIYPDSAMLR